MPLTAIGKTFKPALKDREAELVVMQLLKDADAAGGVSTRRAPDQTSTIVVRVAPEYHADVKRRLERFSFKFEIEEM